MIEKLDNLYTGIIGKSKFKSFLRLFLRVFSNIVIPIHLLIFNKRKIFKLRSKKNETKIIVSFTTFPERINKIWIVLECLFRQSLLPDEIVLYLSIEQFPEKEKSLPSKLIYYLSKNLIDIRFVEDNLRSHKKYYYAFQEFPDALVILVDDDLIYTNNLIKDLVDLNKKFPESICCHRAHLVKRTNDLKLMPYNKWEVLKLEKGPNHTIFHTSGGGTIYNPKFFDERLYVISDIKELCFYADDVWLNIHAALCDIKVVKSSFYSHYIPILRFKDIKLSDLNVGDGLNDKQISRTLNYYMIDEKDIFID